ncbi:MAG: hypothetical protein E7278_09140 [Lachnospiraceae bacterium]|nr:hypothetical protein [Lachnospiraceae bacterium]
MESRSRTEHSARNSSVALISQLIHLLVGFILRIVFTHTLSKDYVGVNGLFLDIIFILSLSELGVGTAITYALYRPIEEGDVEKQKSLMLLYRKFYHIVALVVLGLGLLLIPFMDVLIKDPPNVEHLTIIYLFYLASAVSSYLMIYKRTLMDAHQLAYIGTLYTTGSWVIQDLIQILVLVFTHNFILYLSINLIVTIATNILISRKANKLYPYLRDRDVKPLPEEEKRDIRKNVGAMFLHKLSTVVVNNTDNLLISAFVGIVSVGKYSNYVLITSSLRNIVRSFFQGIMASVGNLGVSKDKARLARIFHATLFINQWVSCFATITLFEIFNLFVAISFGEQYVFDLPVVAMICLNFYLGSMREGILVFRDSLGVFWYDRYKAVAEAIINLVVSIILARYMGTAGVLLGTVISTLTTSAWVEPYMLYKHRLETRLLEYWKRILCYVAAAIAVLFLTDWACNLYSGKPWRMLLYRMCVCLVLPNVLLLIMFFRNREFRFLLQKAKQLLHLRSKKRQESGLGASEIMLLDILKCEFTGENPWNLDALDDEMMTDVIHHAVSHGVGALVYDSFYRNQSSLQSTAWMQRLETISKQVILGNYRLWQQTMYLQQKLESAQIPFVILKGPSLAQYYPVPELRKSGDVDVWIYQPNSPASHGEIYFGEQFRTIEQMLLEDGYTIDLHQHSNYHVGYQKNGWGEVEVHALWAERFQKEEINADIAHLAEAAYARSTCAEVIPGQRVPVLSDEDQVCHMLLHMLHHYVMKGFGLKFLCDWTVFWNSNPSDSVYEQLLSYVKKWHLQHFISNISWLCMTYMGLKESAANRLIDEPVDESLCDLFLQEIFASGEFGKTEDGRMVAPSGNNIFALMGEFHHQMKRNHVKASKKVWLWPYLWVVTLVVFIKNNAKLRNISTFTVLKNACQRAKIRKQMKLFEER